MLWAWMGAVGMGGCFGGADGRFGHGWVLWGAGGCCGHGWVLWGTGGCCGAAAQEHPCPSSWGVQAAARPPTPQLPAELGGQWGFGWPQALKWALGTGEWGGSEDPGLGTGQDLVLLSIVLPPDTRCAPHPGLWCHVFGGAGAIAAPCGPRHGQPSPSIGMRGADGQQRGDRPKPGAYSSLVPKKTSGSGRGFIPTLGRPGGCPRSRRAPRGAAVPCWMRPLVLGGAGC